MAEGLSLAMLGMGTVFFFLTMLVGITMAMSALILRYAPEEAAPVPGAPAADPVPMAAIAAAIHRYRRDRS